MALSRYLLLLVVFFVAFAAHLAVGASALHGVGEPTPQRAPDDASKVKRPLPAEPPRTVPATGAAHADGARRTALEGRAKAVFRSTGSSATPGGPHSLLSMLPARALPRRALKDGATDLNSPLQVVETDSESVSIEDNDFEGVVLGDEAAEIRGEPRRGLAQGKGNDLKRLGSDLAKKAAKKAGEKVAIKAAEAVAKKALESVGGSAVGGVASIIGVGGKDTMLSKVGEDLEKSGKVGRVIGKIMQNKVVNAVVNTVVPKPLMMGLNAAAGKYKEIKKGVVVAGKEIGKGAKAAVKGVGKAGKAVGKAVGGAAKGAVKGVGKAGKAVGKAVGGAAKGAVKGVGKAGKAVGKAVGGAAKGAVKGVGNAAKKVAGAITGLFKKKKASK
ncbi:unnamed protein product [Closterium sp. NIES-64]|nr:unnamed protein product [Closterium sp. NIES-64]